MPVWRQQNDGLAAGQAASGPATTFCRRSEPLQHQRDGTLVAAPEEMMQPCLLYPACQFFGCGTQRDDATLSDLPCVPTLWSRHSKRRCNPACSTLHAISLVAPLTAAVRCNCVPQLYLAIDKLARAGDLPAAVAVQKRALAANAAYKAAAAGKQIQAVKRLL